jgi:hypothetical protein
MKTFNPNLSTREFLALSPEDQRWWNKKLLDYWTEGHPDFHGRERIEEDNRKDAAEERENQMLGNGLEI